MPNWKKVIVSGSDAALSDVTIDGWGSVSASLASLEASSTPTLQDVTDNGNTTTNSITVDSINIGSYLENISGKTTVNNGAVGTLGSSYSATTYAGAVVDYVVYDATRSNQRTGTVQVSANSTTVVHSENVTTDIGNTDGMIITTTIGSGNFNINLDNDSGATAYISYNIKLLKV